MISVSETVTWRDKLIFYLLTIGLVLASLFYPGLDSIQDRGLGYIAGLYLSAKWLHDLIYRDGSGVIVFRADFTGKYGWLHRLIVAFGVLVGWALMFYPL